MSPPLQTSPRPVSTVPLLQSFYILFGVIAGGIFFKEFDSLSAAADGTPTPHRWPLFVLGMLLIVTGLMLIAPPPSATVPGGAQPKHAVAASETPARPARTMGGFGDHEDDESAPDDERLYGGNPASDLPVGGGGTAAAAADRAAVTHRRTSSGGIDVVEVAVELVEHLDGGIQPVAEDGACEEGVPPPPPPVAAVGGGGAAARKRLGGACAKAKTPEAVPLSPAVDEGNYQLSSTQYDFFFLFFFRGIVCGS